MGSKGYQGASRGSSPKFAVPAEASVEAPIPAVVDPEPQHVVLKTSRPPALAPEFDPTDFRLGLKDLVLVPGLACSLGIAPKEALAVVRADVAAAAGRPGVYR